MKESEVKARLAQAEAHISHYRWDDAIALFEAILASHPDHSLATQGWTRAVEQRSVEEELQDALAQARASLARDRFDEALALLNQAQARGALAHILKYHSEIDGLRSEAQEGQEWQRRVEAATREAEALAGRRRFDQALETLDGTLRPLQARGWERLGAGLADLREKLWAERDVSERVQFAQAAYERQDYGLAAELAAALHEELPGRDDARRLHERARGAYSGLQERLAAVNAALAEERTEDALALLSSLRAEHPKNPDWQAIALRVHMAQGRAELARGRAAMVEQAFEDAAEAFEAATAALTAIVEIFPEHPTARQEQGEAEALRQAARSAAQAARDRAAFRWEASAQGWQAGRDQLDRAIAARGRDFGEVAAVIDALLAESQAALADLEQARASLADGRQALAARDAGAAREALRAGLSRVEGGRLGDTPHLNDLREGLAAGLREAERIQRDVKKLLGQAEAAAGERERVALLRRAYERWETAPGLVTQLAEALLAAAASAQVEEEEAALALCAEVGELAGAPAGALSEAARLAAQIRDRRAAQVAAAEAAEQAARAAATEQALAPVVAALREVEAVCEPAADGDLAAVDWDAAERGLKEARKALRAAGRALPQPLPATWEALRDRIDALERRNHLLVAAHERIAAGRGIEAVPALQAHAANDPDPVVLTLLDRLMREGASAAGNAAQDWLAQAVAAIERGELTTAAAYAELAQSYTAAAPQVVPQIRRIERQISLLAEARDRTREARGRAAAGDLAAALAGYRAALELTTDGETGLPADARHEIHRVLDAEDALDEATPTPALLDAARHPLVKEFVAPALGRWWRLARQVAALARIAAQVALGQAAAAADAAAQLAQAYPQDRALVQAYSTAAGRATEAQARRWRRALKRSRWLAEQGAYAEALAEIEPAAASADAGEPQSDEVEALADEAAELRLALRKLVALSEQLEPLLARMREAALADQFDEALAAWHQAAFLDPGRRTAALWEEMDALAAQIEQRQQARVTPRVDRPARHAPEQAPRAASFVADAPSAPIAPPTAPVPAEPPARVAVDAPAEAARGNGASRATLDALREPVSAVAPSSARETREAEPPPAPAEPAPLAIPAEMPPSFEPPAPFDLDDWLNNVTELGPDDVGPGNGS